MPRTKVSKKSKRNREAALRDEQIREFDSALDQFTNSLDMQMKQDILELDTELDLIKSRIPQKMLQMKLADMLTTNVATLYEIKPIQETGNLDSLPSNTAMTYSKRSSDDEGYRTEDSRCSCIENVLPRTYGMRTMLGPLNSAKANRNRRNHSACCYSNNALQSKQSFNTGHLSRQMRTPIISRQKAISADRIVSQQKNSPISPPALLRWPKAGEMVVSMNGTPVAFESMPAEYANVNIPTRDGVLSLRPKKLQSLDPELVDRIDQITLAQIKLLQLNLEVIMSYADTTDKT